MLRWKDVPLLDLDPVLFDTPPESEWPVPGLSRRLRAEEDGDGSLGLYDLVEKASTGPRPRLPRAA